MKHLYFSLLLFCMTRTVHAQTYLAPVVGMDYSNLQSYNADPKFVFFGITDTGFVHQSPFYGFRVKQCLFAQFSINYQFIFTEKNVTASTYGFVGYEGIAFEYMRNNLTLNYKIADWIVVGAGCSFNVVNDVRYVKNGVLLSQIDRTMRERGILYTLGLNHWGFNLEGYYYHGQTMLSNKYFDIFPVRSFGLALSYELEAIRGWKRKKSE